MEQLACRPAFLGLDLLGLRIDLVGDAGVFRPQLRAFPVGPGLAEVELSLTSDQPALPPPGFIVRLSGQAAGIAHTWRSDRNGSGGIGPDWSGSRVSARSASQAPMMCLHGTDGINRLTLAATDSMHSSRLGAGVREEDCRLIGQYEPFLEGRAPATAFSARLRIDTRALPWHAVVQEVGRWWEAMPGMTPLAVPDAGREAMYATWYTFHQVCEPAAVLAECRLARELGCTAVIVDDGWQTLDSSRGYHRAGDWHPERMGDMRSFVDAVHAIGMRVLLWYALPLIGMETAAYKRFAGRMLRRDERLGCGVADPRYPEVRSYLIEVCSRQLAEWGHDGVKLDFIDSMHPEPGMPLGAGDGRDIGDLDEAVQVLLQDVGARMAAHRPDLLIEFRQSYIGPHMRTVGNLFRAADCPYDAVANRARTVTLRMLSGTTAVHADPLMWSPLDPPEVAARQLLAVLFAVPQVSVLLAGLPPGQLSMLRFWLTWWKDHRQTLLAGAITAEEPESHYTLVTADSPGERIVACYADRVVRIADQLPEVCWLINASAQHGLVLHLERAAGERRIEVRDCHGVVVQSTRVEVTAGVHFLAVPASGMVVLAS